MNASVPKESAKVEYIQGRVPDQFSAPQDDARRHQYASRAQRTVQLVGLGDHTTHADIVKVVHGGMLLCIHFAAHQRIANVSFLEASAAHEFMQHVRRNGLDIGGKQVGRGKRHHHSNIC